MAIDLTDKTGNGNDLTNVNGVEVSSDLPFVGCTTAVDLEKDDSAFLHAADSASLSITADLTLEGWFKFKSLPDADTEYALLSKMHHSTAERSYKLGIENFGSRTLAFLYSPDGNFDGDNKKTVAWTPSTDTWYHIAVTFAATTKKINFYVDGSPQGAEQTGQDSSIYNSARRFTISGFDETTPEAFADVIFTEGRVWNVVRTPEEIDDNKAIHIDPESTGLVAYWPLQSLEPPPAADDYINSLWRQGLKP